VNLQQLKHFVAVAEELHFGRAAERIGMAQPPLSQSIRRLEISLGCQLFSRTRRRVELTAPGEALLEHARDIISQVEYSRRAVERAGQTGLAQIRMGYTPNALSDHLPAAVRRLNALAPTLKITLLEANTPEQIEGLSTGDLDIGFFNPPTTQIRLLEVHVVARPRLIAAIPADWPLAKGDRLALVDLADTPLLLPPQSAAGAREAIIGAFRRVGITPVIAQEATFDYTRLKLTAAGMGVSIISETAAPRGYPGVVQRPIADLPDHIAPDLVMAWRNAVAAPVRKLFLAAAEAASAVQAAPIPGPDAAP
jgi:DNA-binding transcriptional LysR family regulator